MTFATIISKYPRLLVCDLSFSQIMKHQREILAHIKKNHSFAARLQLHVSLDVTQNKYIDVSPGDISKPNIKFRSDPDILHIEERAASAHACEDDECWEDNIRDCINWNGEENEMEMTINEMHNLKLESN